MAQLNVPALSTLPSSRTAAAVARADAAALASTSERRSCVVDKTLVVENQTESTSAPAVRATPLAGRTTEIVRGTAIEKAIESATIAGASSGLVTRTK